MYDFKFEDAEKEFNWLVQEYKNHHTTYFFKRLEPLVENRCILWTAGQEKNNKLKKLDDDFLDLMDKSNFYIKKYI